MLFPNPWFDTDNKDGISSQKSTIQLFIESVSNLFNK